MIILFENSINIPARGVHLVIHCINMTSFHLINQGRFKTLLDTSSKIGLKPEKGPGLFRLALSDDDMVGRDWLKGQMKAWGITVYEDEALNIHGVLPVDGGGKVAAPSPENPYVVTGSHHDTVIAGGRLDGALGVLAGIECIVRIKELVEQGTVVLKYPLEVIDFTDEEGRFGGMLGSMCVAGKFTEAEQIAKMQSADSGEGVGELLKKVKEKGAPPSAPMKKEEYCEKCLEARYDQGSIVGYVELHIEQGPVLDGAKEREQIGVVTGICGLWKIEATYDGQANHAGTTPMHMRQNAFEGCARMQMMIKPLLKAHGKETTVCTIGTVNLVPNCPNVVPGKATFTVELRDEDPAVIRAMSEHALHALKRIARDCNLAFNYRTMSNMPPVPASNGIQDIIMRYGKIECAKNNKPAPRLMPSGDAHDAQQIAAIGPMGMIFVPSVNGISHHHSEHTDFEDLVAGANVLLNTMIEMATKGVVDDDDERGRRRAPAGESEISPRKKQKVSGDECNSTDQIVLLCIDLQNMEPTSERSEVDFSDQDLQDWKKNLPQLLGNVVQLQQHARSNPATMEVVHCRIMSMTHDGRDRSKLHKRMNIHVPPTANASQGSFMDGVGPAGDEMVFNKTGSNAFVTTNLHYVLSNMNVSKLVCCGVLTDECVAGTVKAACDLGYDCTVVEDACLAGTSERHDAAIATVRRFASKVLSTQEYLCESV